MALRFTVSAPGKVILSGEHSVVYGKAAVAGVIGLRNSLLLEATDPHQIRLEFDLFTEQQPCTIAIVDFNRLLGELATLCFGLQLPEQIPHAEFVAAVESFLPPVAGSGGDAGAEFRRTCVAAVYLLAGALCEMGAEPLKYGFVVRFRSGLPKGAGLGSSAAFGVCVAAAGYFYANYRLNAACIRQFNDAATSAPAAHRRVLGHICAWAFCSERLMHGNPSGLDNTVCTHGQLVKFYKQQSPQTVDVRVPCDILLIDSAVARSTLVQVQKVAALRSQHPAAIDALMLALDAVAEDLLPLLRVETTAEASEKYPQLARLIELNGDLLRAIGVSHERLEEIGRICTAHGVASKLTGAGGGGYAFAVLPPKEGDAAEATEERVAKLGAALSAAGFGWHRTTVGGAGVVVEDETNGGEE